MTTIMTWYLIHLARSRQCGYERRAARGECEPSYSASDEITAPMDPGVAHHAARHPRTLLHRLHLEPRPTGPPGRSWTRRLTPPGRRHPTMLRLKFVCGQIINLKHFIQSFEIWGSSIPLIKCIEDQANDTTYYQNNAKVEEDLAFLTLIIIILGKAQSL